MDSQDDEDPTIITKMLDEFRSQKPFFRSSMLPPPLGTDCVQRRKLEFSAPGLSDESEKRIKLSTPSKTKCAPEAISPWEFRRIKAEMIKSRSQVIQFEERISKLLNLKLETEMTYDKEKKALEHSLQEERHKVLELERRIEFIRSRESETVNRCNRIQAATESSSTISQALIALHEENSKLKEQLFECKNELETLKNKEIDDIRSMKTKFESIKRENDDQKLLIEELKNELCSKNVELRKLETEQTKLLSLTKKVKDLESERNAYLETKSYVESQNKKLMVFSELERKLAVANDEITRLKSSISSTIYLEELVEDLKNRDKIRETLEHELVKLRTEFQEQRIQLDSWEKLATQFCDLESENKRPVFLVKCRLEELTKRDLWHSSENKNLELKIEHLQQAISGKDKELVLLREKCKELSSSSEAHIATIKRLKKQLTLVSWERNDLRNLLDSCQKDMTINSETHNQLDELQKVIDGYKQRIEQIEKDPNVVFLDVIPKNYLSLEREEPAQLESKLVKENKMLLEKIDELNDQLEYRNLKGDFDPRRTKIIHLKSNPTSEAIQNYEDRLVKANEEICRLRERIKVMEEGHDQNITNIVEERVSSGTAKEVAELKEKVETLEIQKQRLLEVFKKRTQDVREAMNMMFGYRIDFLPNNQFRLRSQYSFDVEDSLLFQIPAADNGTLELLETAYSETLTDFIELHLKQHRSIPLFLASLTVDLFNKQTIVVSTMTDTTVCSQ